MDTGLTRSQTKRPTSDVGTLMEANNPSSHVPSIFYLVFLILSAMRSLPWVLILCIHSTVGQVTHMRDYDRSRARLPSAGHGRTRAAVPPPNVTIFSVPISCSGISSRSSPSLCPVFCVHSVRHAIVLFLNPLMALPLPMDRAASSWSSTNKGASF